MVVFDLYGEEVICQFFEFGILLYCININVMDLSEFGIWCVGCGFMSILMFDVFVVLVIVGDIELLIIVIFFFDWVGDVFCWFEIGYLCGKVVLMVSVEVFCIGFVDVLQVVLGLLI